MTASPMMSATRHTRRERRFDPDAACFRCGITTPETLAPVARRFLEDHHVCGCANDASLTAPVCRNCHAILTEGQHAAGVVFHAPPTILHQLASALASLFTMLHELCERGMTWADALSRLASELDTAFPTWRELPSARALGVGS